MTRDPRVPNVNTSSVSHYDVPYVSHNHTITPTFPAARLPTSSPAIKPNTVHPSMKPTTEPTLAPNLSPSALPSRQPTKTLVTEMPTASHPKIDVVETTAFLVIGDVPYNVQQARELAVQMDNIAAGSADFVVHVGDIRSAADGARCSLAEYQAVEDILKRSKVPMFVIPGDNEWNDCPNRVQAWDYWTATFQSFEGKHWGHDFVIERMSDRPETFSFEWRGSLFVGLNLVGGTVHNQSEWQIRLTDQVEWVKALMRQHQKPTIVFGHANPVNNHDAFFYPLRDFVRDELRNSIPLLYVNGDKHQ